MYYGGALRRERRWTGEAGALSDPARDAPHSTKAYIGKKIREHEQIINISLKLSTQHNYQHNKVLQSIHFNRG